MERKLFFTYFYFYTFSFFFSLSVLSKILFNAIPDLRTVNNTFKDIKQL